MDFFKILYIALVCVLFTVLSPVNSLGWWSWLFGSRAWLEWSDVVIACSVSCGRGIGERTRTCSSGIRSDCYGMDYKLDVCELPECHTATPSISLRPTITETRLRTVWSAWSTEVIHCSVTCDAGVGEITRQCSTGVDSDCVGLNFKLVPCNPRPCAMEGLWNSWSKWSFCTTTCGGGHHNRTRQCIYSDQFPRGAICSGNSSETEICNNNLCPVDGLWNTWSGWSTCTTSCGGGQRTRTRHCAYSSLFPHGAPCTGNASESDTCTNNLCPVNGLWNPWSEWSNCTTTCGEGHQTRIRHCIYAAISPHGADCIGMSSETKICNNLCPSTCATCGDYPTILCEAIYRQNTACPEPYCVNVLVNNALGDRSLERRCGSLKECKEDWWQKSSILDKCTSFDQRLTYREAFNCTYCCTTPNCNEDINPKPASMYKET